MLWDDLRRAGGSEVLGDQLRVAQLGSTGRTTPRQPLIRTVVGVVSETAGLCQPVALERQTRVLDEHVIAVVVVEDPHACHVGRLR